MVEIIERAAQAASFFNVFDVRRPGQARLILADSPEAATAAWRRATGDNTAEIRAKPTSDRRNILISRLSPAPSAGLLGRQPEPGHYVTVRWGYVNMGDEIESVAGRPTGRYFESKSRFDPTALNQVHQLGAICHDPDVDAIRAFVAQLLAVWGPLPVQDNTGFFPELHTGRFEG